jgi:hypothetical protein
MKLRSATCATRSWEAQQKAPTNKSANGSGPTSIASHACCLTLAVDAAGRAVSRSFMETMGRLQMHMRKKSSLFWHHSALLLLVLPTLASAVDCPYGNGVYTTATTSSYNGKTTNVISVTGEHRSLATVGPAVSECLNASGAGCSELSLHIASSSALPEINTLLLGLHLTRSCCYSGHLAWMHAQLNPLFLSG